MAVVVTGAAGFIGTRLVQRLTGGGVRVVAVDRRPAMPPAAAHLVTDLTDPDPALDDALAEAEAVFHLAGRPGVRDTHPEADALRHRDNVVAAERVLARTPPAVPVVVTSSSSVYGGSRGRGSSESDPLRPQGGYARSKVALERRCRERAEGGGATAVARPFTVAGEGQRPDMAIARWLAAVRRGEPIRVLGSADRTRDVTDVADVVEGLVRMAERGIQGTVNLGTGRGHRLADIAAAVCAAAGEPAAVLIEPAGADEVGHTLADTRRCRRLLSLTPRTDLRALVRRQAGATGAHALRAAS